MVTSSSRRRIWQVLGVVVLAGMVGAAGCRSQSLGGVGEICDNGVDDDDDGWVDCGDPDCTEHPICTGEQVCGDGVATGSEECDGNDLRGQTCQDLEPGSFGSLRCGVQCTYLTSECWGTGSCPNGVQEFGEECDCGTDPFNLPPGCTDISGGSNANCSAECAYIDRCGDGFVSGTEECDCGTDPLNLPPGCSDVNGTLGGGCSTTCLWSQTPCQADHWDECDPLAADACCPDDWNAATVCTPLSTGGESYCLRGCNTTTDCYWSNECWAQLGGSCYPSVCGPAYPSDTVNTFCTVNGGGGGWCAPIYDRIDPDDVQYGICIESGTLQHGDSCEPSESMISLDRSLPACELGLCLQTNNPAMGLCRQLCDWEASYDAAIYGLSGEILPCPAGSNCLAYARLDATTNVRTGDLAYCIDQGIMNHPQSATTCSLITGQLLADPATTCAEYTPNGRCHMVQLASGEMSNGTLIGVCSGGQATTRDVWELCDPATDICPQGANCRPEDLFSAVPSGPARCLPICDARMHTGAGDCTTLGAGDPTAVCRSISEKLAPADLSPTRLGLCALP